MPQENEYPIPPQSVTIADQATQQAAAQAQAEAVKPKSHGWVIAVVAIVAVLILMLASMISCTSMVESSLGSLGSLGGLSSLSAYSDDSFESLTGDTVGIIEMDGTIQYDGSTCSPEGLKYELDRAANNAQVKAVVLRINSGGGTATAGEEMAAYVKQFRQDTGKPVVVSSASINASAAYEISSQADYIFTMKTTEIGSIGTAFQVTDLSGLMEKLGVNVDNITSSDSKDSSYGTRALTDEERAYYQDMVDKINETFIENVASGRSMTTDAVRELATGLVFTGMDAVENGLADEIGTKEDAVAKAAELAGLGSEYDYVEMETRSTDISSILDLLSESKSDDKAAEAAKTLKEYLSNDGIAE